MEDKHGTSDDIHKLSNQHQIPNKPLPSRPPSKSAPQPSATTQNNDENSQLPLDTPAKTRNHNVIHEENYGIQIYDKRLLETDDSFGFDPEEDPISMYIHKEWTKSFSIKKVQLMEEWSAYERELMEHPERLQVGESFRHTSPPKQHGKHGTSLSSQARNVISSVTATNVKKLIRKGIPSPLRGKVWLERSGAIRKKAENPGVYAKLVRAGPLDSQVDQEIQLDIARTFAMHTLFANTRTKLIMIRILNAYCVRNPHYGYCQSMTCIVGIILFFLSEEDTFWLFATIMENILPSDFCSPTLQGLRVDQKVLEVLIKERLPKLHAHFSKYDVDISCFTTSWLLKLFVNVFPIETTLRVWDCFLNEGTKVLFRVVLAFLKLYEDDVKHTDNAGDLLTLLNQQSKRFYDSDRLIKTCSSFWILRRKHVNDLRARFIQAVLADDVQPEELSSAKPALNNPGDNGVSMSTATSPQTNVQKEVQ